MSESTKNLSRCGDPHQTLYLVDISSFIFRAFFAIRPLTSPVTGEPTNAIFGVATMLTKLLDEAKPDYLAIVYDSPEPSIRKDLFPDYKSNRSEPPEDLVPQFGRIEELMTLMKFPAFRQSRIEADDLIATLARRWLEESSDHQVVIVTGDKDLMQLVNSRLRVWDTMNDRFYSHDEVVEKFGVKPEQVRDYLGLVGDSSDFIPGVSGIGPKGASDLLKQFGDLDGILQAAKEGRIPGKKGTTLKDQEETARLSARLATLDDQVQIEESNRKSLNYSFQFTSECSEFLKTMGFRTLIERWTKKAGTPAQIPVSSSSTSETFRTVNTHEEFKKMLEGMERAKEFGFDLETTSLNPREAEIVGIAICFDRSFGCYVPIGHRGTQEEQLPAGEVLQALKPFIENPRYKKVGQNLKYDWSVLRENGIIADGIGADTMVAAYVLEPEGRHNMVALAAQYLNYDVLTYEQICGKGKDQICFDQVPVDLATRYSAEDAWVTLKLWDALKPKLVEDGLMEIFAKVDLPLVDLLSRLECTGVCIDESWLKDLSRKFEKEILAIDQRIQAYAKGPTNLNSPKQLAHLLFEELALPTQGKTKTGYSTDARVLETLAPLHEVPRLLLEYREIAKLKGTYIDPLPLLKDRKTGRIHASFHQTVAATGRLSSSDPNLQNIPIRTERGQMIRRAFVPSEGRLLISADYSQIELRLLAHMSGDPDLVDSFQKNLDIHRRTAGEIFGVAPETVDDRQRGIAKAINFGLMYGKTAFGLSQELKISRKEAQEVIDRYFSRYRAVKDFLDRQVEEARERGWTATLMGRKRFLPDIRSQNPAVRQNAERMAMNAPIQGTAADLMKLAMIEVDDELRRGGFAARMIIQVHDEIVLDCPKEEVADIEKLVVRVMENPKERAMQLSVPLRVNVAHGENWMEL